MCSIFSGMGMEKVEKEYKKIKTHLLINFYVS